MRGASWLLRTTGCVFRWPFYEGRSGMNNMWRTTRGESKAGNIVIHVTPLNDLRQHELTAECWCEPELDYENMVAVHNSADGREKFETGERKVS
jgi:hypothetical protein